MQRWLLSTEDLFIGRLENRISKGFLTGAGGLTDKARQSVSQGFCDLFDKRLADICYGGASEDTQALAKKLRKDWKTFLSVPEPFLWPVSEFRRRDLSSGTGGDLPVYLTC